jgi:hypothetical protein
LLGVRKSGLSTVVRRCSCDSPASSSSDRMSAIRFLLHYRSTDSVSLPDAARRRWIGVKGIRSSIMTAKVQVERGPDQLNVRLSPAKLLEGGPVGILQGIAPPSLHQIVIGDAPNEVLVKDLSMRQIALLGFKAPTLAEGMYTNKEVILRRAEGAVLERAHVLESWQGPVGLQMYGVRFAVDDHLDCFGADAIASAVQPDGDGSDEGRGAVPRPSPWASGMPEAAGGRPAVPSAATPMARYPSLAMLFPVEPPGDLLTNLDALDSLCVALAMDEVKGVPNDAKIPTDDPHARFAFANEQVKIAVRAGAAVGRATSGEWNAVFAAVRQLKEAYREATSVSVGVAGMVPPPPPPPPPGGLDSSFSRLAANHTVYSMHQRNTGVTNAPLDEVAISTQQAAVAIDREGILPVGSLRPLSAAAQALVPLSQHGNDPTKVGQLGDALRKLDPALARLAASEGSAININSSESLSNAARCLSTALCAMDAGIAATLRAELRVDEASLSLERREQLLSVSRHILNYRFSRLTDGALLGTNAKTLFETLTERNPEMTFKVLRALQAAVDLFDPPPPGKKGFFAALEASADSLVNQHKASAADVHAYLSERVALVDASFRDFLAGKLSLRPRLSAEILQTKEAVDAFEKAQQQAMADKRAREAIKAELARCGWSQPPVAGASGAEPPLSKKQKKAAKAPAKPTLTEEHKMWDGTVVNKNLYNLHVNAAFTGVATADRPTVDELRAFSRQQGGKCWDFCMRGQCARLKSMKACTFTHEPL